MLSDLLSRWPVVRQIKTGGDGTGPEAMSGRTRTLEPRIKTDGTKVARSICPYCGVGCTLTLHVQDDAIVKVGSPHESSVTNGHLCIKGRFGLDFVRGGK